MDARIDLVADLNEEDNEGLGWSTLSEASDPARIRPGPGTARLRRSSGWWPSTTTGRCTLPCCPGPWRRTVTSSAALWPELPALHRLD